MASDYNTVAVTLAASAAPVQIFTGRPARKCLIVAASVNGTTFVATTAEGGSITVFARLPAGSTLVMPLRDYGPLITGEIWVSNTLGSQLINGSEIFEVPKARR